MRRIFLIGYMGAGKTTVGRLLASQLGLTFVDLDHFIEGRFHKTISELFAEHGEDGFRIIERESLHEVGEFEDAVISVGGGTPCFFDNIEFMNQKGQSIYLKVDTHVLAARLHTGKHTRPLLKDKTEEEIGDFITLMLEKRAPFYEKATTIFDASAFNTHRSIEHMIPLLLQIITEQ